MSKQKAFIDTDNYSELSKPRSREEVVSSIDAFWDEFYELRNKHKLTDVHVIIRTAITGEGDTMTTLHAGSDLYVEMMTAWAFGRAQSDRQAIVSKLMTGDSVSKRART